MKKQELLNIIKQVALVKECEEVANYKVRKVESLIADVMGMESEADIEFKEIDIISLLVEFV